MCCASFGLAIVSIMRGDHKDETKNVHNHETDLLYFGHAYVLGNVFLCSGALNFLCSGALI